MSHFCDLFWNVTMIMNICFMWQYGGQSNNFAPFLSKTYSIGAPRGPQKSARDQNLSKTLADSGRIWLNLVDSDTLDDFWWIWLTLVTLADSGCPPESVRVSQSQPVSAVVVWLWPLKSWNLLASKICYWFIHKNSDIN